MNHFVTREEKRGFRRALREPLRFVGAALGNFLETQALFSRLLFVYERCVIILFDNSLDVWNVSVNEHKATLNRKFVVYDAGWLRSVGMQSLMKVNHSSEPIAMRRRRKKTRSHRQTISTVTQFTSIARNQKIQKRDSFPKDFRRALKIAVSNIFLHRFLCSRSSI